MPPPPIKVIIEKLAPLPPKPQTVIIERWLPYSPQKRKVIYQKLNQDEQVQLKKPKNLIIQWESPKVTVKQELKNLGIIKANPSEYIQKYGDALKNSKDMPKFVLDIKAPNGLVLAADYIYNPIYELEGQLDALKLIDLELEGLSEYKPQIEKLQTKNTEQATNISIRPLNNAMTTSAVSTGSVWYG